MKEYVMVYIPTTCQPSPKQVVKYNIDARWKHGHAIIGFIISNHMCCIIETWHHMLFITFIKVDEAMTFYAALDHVLNSKHKATYMEGDEQVVVKALMEDEWQQISNCANDVLAQT